MFGHLYDLCATLCAGINQTACRNQCSRIAQFPEYYQIRRILDMNRIDMSPPFSWSFPRHDTLHDVTVSDPSLRHGYPPLRHGYPPLVLRDESPVTHGINQTSQHSVYSVSPLICINAVNNFFMLLQTDNTDLGNGNAGLCIVKIGHSYDNHSLCVFSSYYRLYAN
jgi:hypothetical protein